MVTVEIRGKEFPLCLTVAAVDKVNEKCGSISSIGAFLDGKDSGEKFELGRAMYNTAWLLGLLIQEGEENRLINARFDGEKTERREVPDADALCHLLTVGTTRKYRDAVITAVNESLAQDIEASHSKNAKNAEQA